MSPNKPVTITRPRWMIVLAVLAAIALPFGAYSIGTEQNDQCEAIHRVVEAGLKILDSPRNLRIAYERGQLTKAQYDSSLEQIHRFDPVREQNLRDWRAGDCQQ